MERSWTHHQACWAEYGRAIPPFQCYTRALGLENLLEYAFQRGKYRSALELYRLALYGVIIVFPGLPVSSLPAPVRARPFQH